MKIIKSIFFALSLSFMISCDGIYENETTLVIKEIKKLDENYLYTLRDVSNIGTYSFKYATDEFLGMPGDTVMLVPKCK